MGRRPAYADVDQDDRLDEVVLTATKRSRSTRAQIVRRTLAASSGVVGDPWPQQEAWGDEAAQAVPGRAALAETNTVLIEVRRGARGRHPCRQTRAARRGAGPWVEQASGAIQGGTVDDH